MTRYTKLTKNVIQMTTGEYNATIIRMTDGWSVKIAKGVRSGPVIHDMGIFKHQTDARIQAMRYLDGLDH